jgi:hypothetical protein
MPAPVLQFKRGNAGVAGTVPALRPGEPAISLNNFDFFVGIDTSVANNKFFGSHRYWGREDGTNSLRLKLVDKDGSNYVAIKSPNTLAGIVTYVLPGTQGGSQTVLTNDGGGNLSWSSGSLDAVFSGITTVNGSFLDVNVDADFSGITTFSNTTDNTLGDPNTGAVQIAGGVGIAKNLTVGAGLSVGGQSYFIGTATFYSGTLNLGDSDTDNINVAGEFISNLVPNATNTYDLGLTGKRWRNGYYSGNVEVTGNLNVTGDVSVGGTTIILRGTDVFIENKDIILGYTTTTPANDDTANHAGVAIASTEGTPLVSFFASGINTLPDTYKQMMWFKSGTLGFSTDAFAFNYGVAIGTTTMADGTRLAVGSGVTITNDTVNAVSGNFVNLSATNITGSLTGTISTATRATTVDTTSTSTNTNYHLVFTDNATSTTGATMRVDAGIYYNPSSNYLFASQFIGDVVAGTIKAADTTTAMTLANSTGNVTFNGDIQIGGNDIKASDGTTALTLSSSTGNVKTGGDLIAGSGYLAASDGTRALYMYGTSGDVSFQGKAIVNSIRSATDSNNAISLSGRDVILENNVKIVGVTTIGTGVGVTQFSGSVSTGTSTSSVPTSSAVIDYVGTQIGNVDLTLSLAGDTGTGSVNTSQTFTIAGTANEVNTSASGQTITVGLPDDVIVGTSLSAPTVRTNIIKSQNTGATVITLTGNDATFADDLTVQGNLYVQGSTTQIDTTSLTIEDRTIELGRIASGTQPTATSWDLAVLFNYGDGGAKKAGVVWEASGATKRFQFTTDVSPGTDGTEIETNKPQLTVANFAPIEISELWVNNSCTGGSQQVIGCVGAELQLQNITIDAGTF